MTKTCPWYKRWYHRWQRRLDVKFIVPALRRAAADDVLRYGSGERRDVSVLVAAAWALFTAAPGQGHWRCACARADPILEQVPKPPAED